MDAKILSIIFYCTSIFIFLFIETLLPKKIKYSVFTLFEYSCFAIMIFQQLKMLRNKLIIIIASVSFFIFQFLYFLYVQEKQFDSIPIGIEAILIFIFIFLFLYEQLKDVKELPIYQHSFFWMSIGLFIYLGGSFFLYLMAYTLSTKELAKYWFFTYIVEIIKNLLFAASIYIYSKSPTKRKPKQIIPNLDFIM